MRPLTKSIFVFYLLFISVACTRTIPNTNVPDNPLNREILGFMEEYRIAMENRDVGKLMRMASEKYLDVVGTPSGKDDIDYRSLSTHLSILEERVTDVRYDISYRNIHFDRDRILVEYRYRASYLIKDENGEEHWSRRIGDQRAVLTRNEKDELRFLSGM